MFQLMWEFENLTARRLYRLKITGSANDLYDEETHKELLTEIEYYRKSSYTIRSTGEEEEALKKLKAELMAQLKLEKTHLNMWRKALKYAPQNAENFDDGPLKTVADVRWQFHRHFKSRWRKLGDHMIEHSRLEGTRQVFLTPDDQWRVESVRNKIDNHMAITLDLKIDDLTQAKLKELLSGVELALVKALKRRFTNDQKL